MAYESIPHLLWRFVFRVSPSTIIQLPHQRSPCRDKTAPTYINPETQGKSRDALAPACRSYCPE